jgi:hypothetical protein
VAELVGHRHDRPDDALRVAVARQVADELEVDLDLCHREAL